MYKRHSSISSDDITSTIAVMVATRVLSHDSSLAIASGAVAIFVVPFIYFGIGWLIGLVNGVVLTFLIEIAGGIELNITDNK